MRGWERDVAAQRVLGAGGGGSGGCLLVEIYVQHPRLFSTEDEERRVQVLQAVLVQGLSPLVEGLPLDLVHRLHQQLIGLEALFSRPNVGDEVGTGETLLRGGGCFQRSALPGSQPSLNCGTGSNKIKSHVQHATQGRA